MCACISVSSIPITTRPIIEWHDTTRHASGGENQLHAPSDDRWISLPWQLYVLVCNLIIISPSRASMSLRVYVCVRALRSSPLQVPACKSQTIEFFPWHYCIWNVGQVHIRIFFLTTKNIKNQTNLQLIQKISLFFKIVVVKFGNCFPKRGVANLPEQDGGGVECFDWMGERDQSLNWRHDTANGNGYPCSSRH